MIYILEWTIGTLHADLSKDILRKKC